MYCLQQLFSQFQYQLINYDIQGWPGWWTDAFSLVSPEQNPRMIPGSMLENLGSQMNPEDMQEFLRDFQDRLEWLTLDRTFIAGQLQIMINGLTPIARWEVVGYNISDPEYQQLRATINRLQSIHTRLVSEIGELNERIHMELTRHVNDVEGALGFEAWEEGGEWHEIDREFHVSDDPRFEEELSQSEQISYHETLASREEYRNNLQDRIDALRSSRPEFWEEIIAMEQELIVLDEEFERILSLEWSEIPSIWYPERLSILERNAAHIQWMYDTFNARIYLLENPDSTDARHEYLRWVYDTIPEEMREWLVGNDIESLTAGDIYSLRERGIDLSTIFLMGLNGIPCAWKDTMERGNTFRVNFWNSDAADRLIGAGDILPIDQIYSLKVNGVEGIRWFSPRPWYYTPGGRYLAIHDGYQIEIWEMREVTEEELQTMQTAQHERLMQFRSEDIATILENLEGENPEIPLNHETDIEILQEMIQETGIDEIRYNSETRRIEWPNGMDFNDIREALSWYESTIQDILSYLWDENLSITALSEGWESVQKEIDGVHPRILQWAIAEIITWNNNFVYDTDSGILRSQWNARIQDLLGGWFEYEWNGTVHLRYMSEIRAAASSEWVPVGAIIQLIYHENARWDPNITAPGSSAYGLWQMIDGTWATYWRWLNRRDPWDQLLATARYMRAIKERQNCPWEHVLAYYNTWEGILSISQSRAQNFLRLNPAIARQIPQNLHVWITPQNYFIGAIAYYNNMTFERARATL